MAVTENLRKMAIFSEHGTNLQEVTWSSWDHFKFLLNHYVDLFIVISLFNWVLLNKSFFCPITTDVDHLGNQSEFKAKGEKTREGSSSLFSSCI